MKLNPNTVLIVGAGAVVLFLLYRARNVLQQTLSTSLNPTSDQNLAYRGVNGVGAAVTGDQGFSLGSYIYDLFHDEYDPNAIRSLPSRSALPYSPYAPGDARSEYVTKGDSTGIGGGLFSDTIANIGRLIGTPVGGTPPQRTEYVTRNPASGGVQSDERANGYVY